MSFYRYKVMYKKRKPNKSSSTTARSSGQVKQQSETLVMQELRKRYKDYEIELIELKWE